MVFELNKKKMGGFVPHLFIRGRGPGELNMLHQLGFVLAPTAERVDRYTNFSMLDPFWYKITSCEPCNF